MNLVWYRDIALNFFVPVTMILILPIASYTVMPRVSLGTTLGTVASLVPKINGAANRVRTESNRRAVATQPEIGLHAQPLTSLNKANTLMR